MMDTRVDIIWFLKSEKCSCGENNLLPLNFFNENKSSICETCEREIPKKSYSKTMDIIIFCAHCNYEINSIDKEIALSGSIICNECKNLNTFEPAKIENFIPE